MTRSRRCRNPPEHKLFTLRLQNSEFKVLRVVSLYHGVILGELIGWDPSIDRKEVPKVADIFGVGDIAAAEVGDLGLIII